MKNKEQIVEWNGLELQVDSFDKSHANGGRLQKFWVTDRLSGRQFLIKASGYFSFEPFSEKLAYIIGKDLGFDVLEYDIIPSKLFKGVININPFCKYVSICEKIDRKGYSITSVAEIKRARNVVRLPGEPKITNREVMYEILPKEYIDKMILFDAIIGNTDRHYGNVHLLRDTDGNFVGAPLLDNGASLLAQSMQFNNIVHSCNIGEQENESSMIQKNHDAEMALTGTLRDINYNLPAKTIQIMIDIEPVLKLMTRSRGKSIKKYITYRLHKYLGYLKQERRDNINISENLTIEEKEHT